jgi:mannosyl-oligosaccharide alpha-1,2-mannosidase
MGGSPVFIEEPNQKPPPPAAPTPKPVWSERAASVKEAFLHAYGGYERGTNFPDDELKPVSNTSVRK